MNRRFELLIYLGLAIGLTYFPVVSTPLKWFEVFFHETSHALAAVFPGGTVKFVEMNFDGSGLAQLSGGIHPIMMWAGYAGAIFWGALLYAMGSAMAHNTARLTTAVLLLGCAFQAVFWLKADVATYTVMFTLMSILALALHPLASKLARPLLRLIGAFVLVSAIVSPSYLLQVGQTQENDAVSLETLVGLPASVWAYGWMGLGILTAATLYWWEGKSQREQAFHNRFRVPSGRRWWQLKRA